MLQLAKICLLFDAFDHPTASSQIERIVARRSNKAGTSLRRVLYVILVAHRLGTEFAINFSVMSEQGRSYVCRCTRKGRRPASVKGECACALDCVDASLRVASCVPSLVSVPPPPPLLNPLMHRNRSQHFGSTEHPQLSHAPTLFREGSTLGSSFVEIN